MKKVIIIKKIITGVLLFGFIAAGLIDGLMNNKSTYSSIMGMNVSRLYFYSFTLFILGCWLLYNKWFVGIGFLSLAAFSVYFPEYKIIHNYFASILVYIGILADMLVRREFKWLIPLLAVGVAQGIAFQYINLGRYFVGGMEFLALSIGSVFILKNIKWT